jgi:hypothetical protein
MGNILHWRRDISLMYKIRGYLHHSIHHRISTMTLRLLQLDCLLLWSPIFGPPCWFESVVADKNFHFMA